MRERPAEVVDALEVRAYTVPTERPESDGTFAWDATTIVVAEPAVGGCRGLGFTYSAGAAAVPNDSQADAPASRAAKPSANAIHSRGSRSAAAGSANSAMSRALSSRAGAGNN